MTAELNYLPPIVENDIVQRNIIILEPKEADINNVSRLTFEIPNAEYNCVLDQKGVHMRALVEFQNIEDDNRLLDSTELHAVPSMNLIHNLWRNIKVEIAGKVVSSQDFHYPQRAMLYKLATATKNSQDLEFSSSLFRIDEDLIGPEDQFVTKFGKKAGYWQVLKGGFNAGAQEKIGEDDDAPVMISPETYDNLAAKLLKEFLRDRGTVEDDEKKGRPHLLEDNIYEIPFYLTPNYLPFGLPVKVEFEKHTNKYYYIKGANAKNYVIKFKEFQLVIPFMQLSSEKFAEINKMVEDPKTTLDLWITREVVREKTIATDQSPLTFYDLFVNEVTDVLPERVIFSFVTSKTLNGDPLSSNFYFRNHDLRRWFLTLPSRQIVPDPANGEYDFEVGLTEQAYKEFVDVLQLDRDGLGSVVDESLFAHTFSFFGVRLTPKDTDPQVAQAT